MSHSQTIILHLKVFCVRSSQSLGLRGILLTSRHEVSPRQMGKPWSTDTAPIWPIGAVAEKESWWHPQNSFKQLTKPGKRPFHLLELQWRHMFLPEVQSIPQKISVELLNKRISWSKAEIELP